MTTAETSEALYGHLIDAFNDNDFDSIDEFLAEDIVVHEAGQPEPLRGPEALKEFFSTYRAAFSDARLDVEALLSTDDLVVARWTGTGTHDGDLLGIAPTGNDVSIMGMEMYRVADGRFVEGWGVFDLFGMLQQVGVLPEDPAALAPAADD